MAQGNLQKMKVEAKEGGKVHYQLILGDDKVLLNDKIGYKISLTYSSTINCIHCGRKTSKSFSQGYCYPCFRSLAQCDLCIMKPETCHFHFGTCREPEWAKAHCFIPHVVYLANSSGLKVGITRAHQMVTRWIDQGAIQAIPLCEVTNRRDAGIIESLLKNKLSDKTNWRKMLQGKTEPIDLHAKRQEVLEALETSVEWKEPEQVVAQEFHYPVEKYPEKVKTHNFDKNPLLEGVLEGIKGQYLLLNTGVINIRKFGGYHVELNL